MILVTGGSGAMGSVLVHKLREKGEKLRACVLPGDPFVSRIENACEDIRYADITNKSGIEGICDGVTTVYHLAAVIISRDEGAFQRINVEGTRNIIEEAQRANVGHFIHVSSASVTYRHPTPYSLSKRKAEDLVKSSGIPYTIARPTLVYGKTGGLEFDRYLDYLKKFPIVPFIGNGAALKRPVFVDDVIAGLVALFQRKEAYGKIYNFSGKEAINMLDFSRLCLMLLNMPNKRIVHLPVWLCMLIARIAKALMKDPPLKWQVIAGIIQDANLDPGLAIAEIGYRPRGVTECLPKCFPRDKK
jgi:nucleoside-diphosphate-sugar epimerase